MKTLPTLAGLVIILGGVFAGVGLVRYQTYKNAKANEDLGPKQVKISNVNEAGFSVSWISDKAAVGYVLYGESEETLLMKAEDERNKGQTKPQTYYVHYVNVAGLKPMTQYWFKLGMDNKNFGLGEKAYRVLTGATLTDQPQADAAYGQITTTNNDPAEGAVVYLQIPGAGLLSTFTKPSGAWAIPLAGTRTEGLDKLATWDKKTGRMSIWVESGNLGNASAEITAGLINPVPSLMLGKAYDFTQTTASEIKAGTSKFVIKELPIPTSLNLLSPMEKEAIATDKPVIIGKAPPGTKISIEINSETAIVSEVVADETGNFSFQVPQNLPEGEHTVTISGLVNGVLKTIKKSFVVSAKEFSSPYYTATPSATLKPTAKPTIKPIALAPTATPVPTVKPTATPRPSPTIKPTVTPRPSPTATEGVARPTVTPRPTATPIPTATPRPSPTATVGATKPTVTPRPTKSPQPTETIEIPKSGTGGMTLGVLILGASLMLLGYTLGNDKQKGAAHRI